MQPARRSEHRPSLNLPRATSPKRELLHISRNKDDLDYILKSGIDPVRDISPSGPGFFRKKRDQAKSENTATVFARAGSGQLSTTRDWGISVVELLSGR